MQGRHKALIVEPNPYQIIRLLGRPSFQQDPLFVAAPLKSPKTCAHADGFGGIGEVADLERIAILEKTDLFAGRRQAQFPLVRIDPRDLPHALVHEVELYERQASENTQVLPDGERLIVLRVPGNGIERVPGN